MTSRLFRLGLRLAGSACALLLALLEAGCSREAPPERIVLIVVDTLRRDALSVYGGSVDTPALAALAQEGLVFDTLLASFHQTSMSMGSLFTGRTPSIESRDSQRPLPWNGETWCGMARFARPDETLCIPSTLSTLAEALAEGGYWTAGVASNEFLYRPSGFEAGFDDWTEVARAMGSAEAGVPPPLQAVHADRVVVPWPAVNRLALAAVARRPHDRFFLYVHYMDAHDFEATGIPYSDGVVRVDRGVGQLLDRLRALGLLEDAVVVFTSDHGERLGDPHPVTGSVSHLGNPSFLEVLEVPLVVSPARAVPARFRDASLLRTEDVHHLVREIAGFSPGAVEAPLGDDLLIGELHYRTFVRGRYKSSMRRSDGRFHLFDRESDPHETVDVAEAHPDVVRDHLVRANEASKALQTDRSLQSDLTESDRRRLRVLGYLD